MHRRGNAPRDNKRKPSSIMEAIVSDGASVNWTPASPLIGALLVTLNVIRNRNMSEATACKVQPAQMDKHLFVHQAIQEINSVVQSLDSLLARIQGPVPQDVGCEKVKHQEPTLAELLNGGPDEIREKIGNAHSLISEINERLF